MEKDLVGDAVQYLVTGVVLGMFAYRGDGYWLSMVLGGIFNGCFAKLLKRAIQLPRPQPQKRATSGMPSSHAYLLVYFATLASFENDQYGALLQIGALLTCVHRVWMQYHTLAQCIAGALVGYGMAVVWHQSALHAALYAMELDTSTHLLVLACILALGTFISKYRRVITG